MTFRAYLTLLRPVATLLLAGIYAFGFGAALVGVFGGASRAETIHLVLAVVAPVVFGIFLIGPVHEVMHRELCLLLPGARRALRRWHLTALATVGALFFAGTEFSGLAFPRAATLGLILAGLTFSLLDKHAPTPAALFLKGGLLAAGAACLLHGPRTLLIEAANAQPWLFLAAGALWATFCLRHGFSDEKLRARSRSPQLVLCVQSLMPFPGTGNFDLLHYAQSVNVRNICTRKNVTDSKDWSRSSVGASLRDWLAVIHHTRFGAAGSARQFLLVPIITSLPGFACALVLPAFLQTKGTQGTCTFAETCARLSESSRAGGEHTAAIALLLVFGLIVGISAIINQARAVLFQPQRLPIARSRLAHCMALELLRIAATLTVVIAAELALLVTAATLLSGHPLSLALFARPAAMPLITLPLALLGIAYLCRTAQSRPLLLGGFLLAFMIGCGMPGILIAQAEKHESLFILRLADAILTPNGLAIWLTATATAVALVWLALRRHFRTCDLSRPLPWMARTA
jgi:hypothetical protein